MLAQTLPAFYISELLFRRPCQCEICAPNVVDRLLATAIVPPIFERS